MSSAFATLEEVITLTGKDWTEDEEKRIEALLPILSDTLRIEAAKVGKDIDGMILAEDAYKSVVKLVMADIIVRIMRQSQEGEPMSQESQSAMGYSWSGTYAIPGGGMAGAILRNDLKRLGLRTQTWGSVDLCPKSKE